MPVPFLGIAATNDGCATMSRSGTTFDLLGDAVDFGRHIVPLVREEIPERDAERTAREARTPAVVNA
jgi:hypothetical protein